jgi:NADPH:quinone reductase-like Zn-dependent oxidoreductase
MRAAIYETYGGPEVLKVVNLPLPAVKDDEVLIKVHASSVTAGDWRARSLKLPKGFGFAGRLMFGINGPRQPILGTEIAGTVVEIGKLVKKFKVGDEVFAFPGAKFGGYVEYKVMPENGRVCRKPANLSFEQATALSFGGTTALHFLRKTGVKRGQKVLINGASGGVGSATVQLAKYYGAEVTAVCSGQNADLVRSIGADHVIDYKKEDFSQNGQKYDVIIDTVGNARFERSRGSLVAGGRLGLVIASLGEMASAPLQSWKSGLKIISGSGPERREDIELLAQIAAEGRFTPVIDRSYSLEQIAEAHRYVEAGHKKGNVVINICS